MIFLENPTSPHHVRCGLNMLYLQVWSRMVQSCQETDKMQQQAGIFLRLRYAGPSGIGEN